MAGQKLLLQGGIVLSLDSKVGNFHKADVLIDGTTIAQVGPNLNAADAEIIDASDTIVMPGFVDTHRHIWEGILRNIGTDVPLEGDESYLAFILNTLAPVFRPEDVYAGNLVSALGAIDAGITTLLDWSHIQASPEHTDAGIKALHDSGLRTVFAYGFPWWGEWNENQPDWFLRAAKEHFTSIAPVAPQHPADLLGVARQPDL
jgi:cytosine/adenosine deaminase-related metal-dependent hydrolase